MHFAFCAILGTKTRLHKKVDRFSLTTIADDKWRIKTRLTMYRQVSKNLYYIDF